MKDQTVTVGEYVIAPTPPRRPTGHLGWGVWDGHCLVHTGTKADCVTWAESQSKEVG